MRRLAQTLHGQHHAIEQWANEYKTPVVGLKLGGGLVVIAMTHSTIREVCHDDAFLGRPDNFFFRLRNMGTKCGISLAEGRLWTEQRGFAMQHLRQAGYGRRPMEIRIREELESMIDHIDGLCGRSVVPADILSHSVLNVLWMFVAGKRFERNDDRLTSLMKLLQQRSKAFDVAGGFLSQLPWLRFVAPERSGFNLINRFNRDIYAFLEDTIAEHHRDYTPDKSGDDLCYAFISKMRSEPVGVETNFTDFQLALAMLDLFIGGATSTSVSVDLLLMSMVMFPAVQRRVHAELDDVLAGEPVKYADRSRLPYTEAVVWEASRFFHIMPLAGPRRTLSETQLGGFRIPKHTTVFTALSALHMDREYWGDPEVFRPERFLGEERSKVERLLSFSLGKRKCLAESLAVPAMFTFFAGLLQKFSMELAAGEPMPDRNLVPGVIMAPKRYRVRFERR